jgi:hypothetical protein
MAAITLIACGFEPPPNGEPAGPPPLVESRACDQAPGRRDSVTGTTSGDAQQTLSVAVPPTALLRVDASGTLESVATNTGCAPRADDVAYYIGRDGSIAPAPAGALARTWVGDFTQPGVYVRQRA